MKLTENWIKRFECNKEKNLFDMKNFTDFDELFESRPPGVTTSHMSVNIFYHLDSGALDFLH